MYSRAVLFALLCWTCNLQGTSAKKGSINLNKYLANIETYTEITKTVSAGTNRAVDTCKYIFQNEIWNCYVNEEKISLLPVFVRNILPANREGAFLQSLGSAGVMYTLIEYCRKGKFKDCANIPVDRAAKEEGSKWRWYGYNENVKFGEAMAKKFMDELENNKMKHQALNLHNNKIGRKIVKAATRKICKCHGITGSCKLKTCYRELLPFSRVGQMLHMKYMSALQVEFINDKLAEKENQKPLQKKTMDIVYYDSSPDYCQPDPNTKYPGMEGRKCSTETQELSKCENPCSKCNMHITKTTKTKVERCRCKFRWCCRVECEICNKKLTDTTCVKKDGS